MASSIITTLSTKVNDRGGITQSNFDNIRDVKFKGYLSSSHSFTTFLNTANNNTNLLRKTRFEIPPAKTAAYSKPLPAQNSEQDKDKSGFPTSDYYRGYNCGDLTGIRHGAMAVNKCGELLRKLSDTTKLLPRSYGSMMVKDIMMKYGRKLNHGDVLCKYTVKDMKELSTINYSKEHCEDIIRKYGVTMPKCKENPSPKEVIKTTGKNEITPDKSSDRKTPQCYSIKTQRQINKTPCTKSCPQTGNGFVKPPGVNRNSEQQLQNKNTNRVLMPGRRVQKREVESSLRKDSQSCVWIRKKRPRSETRRKAASALALKGSVKTQHHQPKTNVQHLGRPVVTMHSHPASCCNSYNCCCCCCCCYSHDGHDRTQMQVNCGSYINPSEYNSTTGCSSVNNYDCPSARHVFHRRSNSSCYTPTVCAFQEKPCLASHVNMDPKHRRKLSKSPFSHVGETSLKRMKSHRPCQRNNEIRQSCKRKSSSNSFSRRGKQIRRHQRRYGSEKQVNVNSAFLEKRFRYVSCKDIRQSDATRRLLNTTS